MSLEAVERTNVSKDLLLTLERERLCTQSLVKNLLQVESQRDEERTAFRSELSKLEQQVKEQDYVIKLKHS